MSYVSLLSSCIHSTKRGANQLDLYLSKKHDELLARTLEPGSYRKTLSLVIVDGFAVEITEDQVMHVSVFLYKKGAIYICLLSSLLLFGCVIISG